MAPNVQERLCPPVFQSARWQAREQYRLLRQREHRLSLCSGVGLDGSGFLHRRQARIAPGDGGDGDGCWLPFSMASIFALLFITAGRGFMGFLCRCECCFWAKDDLGCVLV